MATHQRPVGLIDELVQQIGLEVIDQYDGLIFVSHNYFILQSTERDTCFDLYFNESIEEEKARTMLLLLEGAAQTKGLNLLYKGAFCLTAKADDEVELELFDLSGE